MDQNSEATVACQSDFRKINNGCWVWEIMSSKNIAKLAANKIANDVAIVDAFALRFIIACSFIAPVIAIFVWAEKKDWTAWIQAIGSVEAIIAAALIAVGTHRMSIKAQRARQVEEHVRARSNLKSLIEETYSYLVYVRDHAKGGLDKYDSAVLFPPRFGSNKSNWSDYSWKASDIRRSMSLFEKNIEQLSTIDFANLDDPFLARNMLTFISYSRTLLEEINTGWDLLDVKQETQAENSDPDNLDSFKYRPGTPNLSPTQKKIGLSHTIARGFMGYYFENDLPVLIHSVYEQLIIRLDTECGA
ncbi:hypothetical protein HGO40_00245 [Pseudomonas sp. CG7]|uniref:hypothetical protein n=1 Tax=Pseudomonas sp. CG7 TaxID=191007 RepID=UPI002033B55F|nr:hypothetical protein [Pseudomonas sp. CG7]MCM2458944.1 hypothetical protein [Pseudomonas sp. CG7]